ncbi:hypothetical protein BGZ61DRAFT_531529 [Ilyonectria robusta]|uniref:uncharacterized protein n=1 Tax=Ilyonectria robusta TaxID=1079257 RepID=UPI001E8D736E|nr:uncharacterized protein BGZ61DRAFT_531529 [Ilyonectria robusta]KAH8706325.1 hypothetical protein BGZ61DRAFT_531529 [Ilyonectria robusta]
MIHTLPLHRAAYLVLCLFSTVSFARVFLTRRDALTSCLADARVPFSVKNSTEWTQDTKPYNLRLAYTPAAVAVPTSIDEIKAAVSCGVKNGVRVSAKGGGHGYGSFALGGEDGHLVIALDRMYRVTLNDDGTATVQPGARLGHVAVELFNQGRRAIAHGSCPGVGISGHSLHGGYGFASRTHGLAVDWLIGAKVVLADGSLVHCSATQNQDLFWALRGAGSSFGIVAELEFDTFEAPDKVTPFSIELNWSEDEAVVGIKALQDIAADASKELNMQIYMAPGGQTIQGVYYGDQNGLNAALRPLLDDIDTQISEASTIGWIEGLEHFADGQELDQTYPYDAHTTSYKSSLMTHALTQGQIESFMSAVFTNLNDPSARHSWFILLNLHGGANSVVAEVPPYETAYVHRDKLLLYQFSDRGSDGVYPEEGFALLKGFRESVTGSMAAGEWGMYANYLDTELDSETAQKLYWGDNLPRLRQIKAAVDPGDVFWNPQGVRPAI